MGTESDQLDTEVAAENHESPAITPDCHEPEIVTLESHEQSTVTANGHESDAVTETCHESSTVTETCHDSDAVTETCHDSDGVTPERHDSDAVTANGHDSDAVTADCHNSALPAVIEVGQETEPPSGYKRIGGYFVSELLLIDSDLEGMRKHKRRKVDYSKWPRVGNTDRERQRFRRARLKLGILTPFQLITFVETHNTFSPEYRFLYGRGPVTPEEREYWHLGPETEQEREFWKIRSKEEKDAHRREVDTVRQQRHRAKLRKKKIPAEEVDILSTLIAQAERGTWLMLRPPMSLMLFPIDKAA